MKHIKCTAAEQICAEQHKHTHTHTHTHTHADISTSSFSSENNVAPHCVQASLHKLSNYIFTTGIACKNITH